MKTLILFPHPENKNIFYNANQIVKIEKESMSIYVFYFTNGDRIRVFDIDIINKVREIADIKF